MFSTALLANQMRFNRFPSYTNRIGLIFLINNTDYFGFPLSVALFQYVRVLNDNQNGYQFVN